jgi:hypothetical protein
MLKIALGAISDIDAGELLPAKETGSVAERALNDLGIMVRARLFVGLSDADKNIEHVMELETNAYASILAAKAIQGILRRTTRHGTLV